MTLSSAPSMSRTAAKRVDPETSRLPALSSVVAIRGRLSRDWAPAASPESGDGGRHLPAAANTTQPAASDIALALQPLERQEAPDRRQVEGRDPVGDGGRERDVLV